MESIGDHRLLRLSLNKWYQNEKRDTIETGACPLKREPTQQLTYITNLLLHFSQENLFSRLKSEYILLNKIFNTARHQIRSFMYVATLKKLKQTIRKLFNLKLAETCSSFALGGCTFTKLMTKSTLASIEWRMIAAIELVNDIHQDSANLIELLTEEMTTSVFLHYPIAFTSLGSSITSIAEELQTKIFDLFKKFRTMEQTNFIPFPDGEDPTIFPSLPWNDDFKVQLEVSAAEKPIKISPTINKLNLTASVKPSAGLRGKPKTAGKPKSALSNLGF